MVIYSGFLHRNMVIFHAHVYQRDWCRAQGEAPCRCDHIQLVVELLRSGLAVPERKLGEMMGKANKGMTRIDHLAELLEKLR